MIKESGSRFGIGSWTIDPLALRASRGDDLVMLTPKEAALLGLLAERAGRVTTYSEILHIIWGIAPETAADPLERPTVANTVSHLRKKLKDDSIRPSLIENIRGVGYRLIASDEPLANDDGEFDHDDSPYRGLAPFEARHKSLFFGRDRAIAALYKKLRKQAAAGRAFVLVTGSSGSGKTSLLAAGLLPAMQDRLGGYVHYLHFHPGQDADVLLGLAQSLHALTVATTSADELAHDLLHDPCKALALLRARLRDVADDPRREHARLLLAIDPLEAIFTASQATEGVGKQLGKVVSTLVHSGFVDVVAGMRSDYYPQLVEIAELTQLVKGDGLYTLTPPSPSELRAIIEQPALRAGVEFEDDAESEQSLVENILASATAQPNALPMLEFTLDELFHNRDSEGRMTFEAYKRLGGIEGCIARRAESVYGGCPRASQRELPRILDALASVPMRDDDRTTAVVGDFDRIATTPEARTLIDAFVAARLFSTGAAAGRRTLNVAHDALLHRWERSANYLVANRGARLTHFRLSQEASRWLQAERDCGYLLTSGPLAEAQRLQTQNLIELSETEGQFVAASEHFFRRSRSLRRTLTVSVAALFLTATVIGVFTWQSQRQILVHTRTVERAMDSVTSLFNLADPLSPAGTPVTVMDFLDHGVQKVAATLRRQPLELAMVLHTIGRVYMNLSELDKAEPLLQRALDIRMDHLSSNHIDTARTRNALGKLRYFQGRFGDAQNFYDTAAGSMTSQLDAPHADLAQLLNDRGQLASATGRFPQALKWYEEALAMRQELFGNEHSAVAESLNNLAGVLRQTGAFERAENLYRQAIATGTRVFGEQHVEVATAQSNLGLLLNERGRFASAAVLHRKALEILREQYPGDHAHLGQGLNNLSATLVELGELDAAEPIMRESIELHDRVFSVSHPLALIARNNLAKLLQMSDRKDEAASLFRAAYRGLTETLGAEHPTTAVIESNLAGLLADMGALDEAENLGRHALDVLRAVFPDGHLRTEVARNVLGGVLTAKQNFTEARKLLESSTPAIVAQLGNRSVAARQALARLSQINALPVSVDPYLPTMAAERAGPFMQN